MELEKIRNLSDGELEVEQRKVAEQLFRLRFQIKLGQNEGVKKLRELRKDVARILTVERERELGLHGAIHKTESSAPVKRAKAKKKAAKTVKIKKTATAKKTVKAKKAVKAKKPTTRKTAVKAKKSTKKEAR